MIPTPLSGFLDKPSFLGQPLPFNHKPLQHPNNDIKVVSIKIKSHASSKRTSLASPINDALRLSSALLSKKPLKPLKLNHPKPSAACGLFKSNSSHYNTSTPSTNSSRLTGSFHKP